MHLAATASNRLPSRNRESRRGRLDGVARKLNGEDSRR